LSSFITRSQNPRVKPEGRPGAFILLQPQAEHLLGAIGANVQCDMDGLVANHPFIAGLHPDRGEENERINRIKRPLLPGGDFVERSG
jgi:hypothetical protein